MAERECPNCGELMGRGPMCAACMRVYAVALAAVVALIVALVWLAVAWRHGELTIRLSIARQAPIPSLEFGGTRTLEGDAAPNRAIVPRL
jgi:hypothetical protein